MSFDVVLDGLDSVEKHIKTAQFDAPYEFEREYLEQSKQCFLKWLEIYRMYTNGYRQEILSRTLRYVIRMLSSFTSSLENQVRDVFEARIPSEAYLFVNSFLEVFSTRTAPSFVLSENKEFKQTSVSDLLKNELANVTLPRPSRGMASLDVLMGDLRNNDILVICYDEGQFDSVFSWPLLLHEAFHYFHTNYEFERIAKLCPSVSWLEEALIDMYIVNYFGPAYALSLATYLQKYPHEKTVSHPSFVSRIFIALKYLNKMQEEKKLPLPTCSHIVDVYNYLSNVWNEHKEADSQEVLEQVGQVYDAAQDGVKELIRKKTEPFAEFLLKNQNARDESFKISGYKFSEEQVLSISDVMEYFDSGIPAAADPRIIYNSFISKNRQDMINDRKTCFFIKESIKKWYLKDRWKQAKLRLPR